MRKTVETLICDRCGATSKDSEATKWATVPSLNAFAGDEELGSKVDSKEGAGPALMDALKAVKSANVRLAGPESFKKDICPSCLSSLQTWWRRGAKEIGKGTAQARANKKYRETHKEQRREYNLQYREARKNPTTDIPVAPVKYKKGGKAVHVGQAIELGKEDWRQG